MRTMRGNWVVLSVLLVGAAWVNVSGGERSYPYGKGLDKWKAQSRPLSQEFPKVQEGSFRASVRPEYFIDMQQVKKMKDMDNVVLLDARPEKFYQGKGPWNKPGHIPGAVNHFFGWNLDEHGTFRSPEELSGRLKNALGNVPPDHVICYCGSGVTACHNLLALEHAGLPGAALYAGSWSEWSSDPARPVEKGEGADRIW